jgi:GTPase SAR1 family protein
MTSSYKLKLILGGAAGSGKTTFLHGTPVFDSPIGVSFKTVECVVNDGDDYTFMVWDLKATPRFHFLYDNFCRGACGAILCFDTSDRESFATLNYWIDLVRRIAGGIPIFIVGTKIDLIGQVVSDEEVEEFINNHDLVGVYRTTSQNQNLLKKTKEKIFKRLIENVDPGNYIKDFSILRPKDDQRFIEFTQFFSRCPVCRSDNHYDSLKKFFYSREPYFIALKEKLIELVEESRSFSEVYYNPIQLGIPCCKCYKEIFSA